MAPEGVNDLLPTEDDLLYEEEVLRNPFSVRLWIRYIEARTDAPQKKRFLLYERAIAKLPGSYKLWHKYLKERSKSVRGLRPGHSAITALNNAFERALVTMHKMPRIWIELVESLVDQGFVTRTRRTLDRALAALPVTQHDRLWQLYLKFVTQPDIPMDTAFRVYRRYLKMEPGHREEYIEYLRAKSQWGAVARELAACVNNDAFRSMEGKTKHTLWLELCDVITKHPDDMAGLDISSIIRAGIRKFTNEVGRLWCALADFYIRQGLFERARDVYQEGIESVMTVRDFTLVFEALTKFEQALVEAQIEKLGDEDEGLRGPPEGDGSDFLLQDDKVDIDLRLERLEWLLAKRAELLNSVLLRQNPHNVQEWHKRVHLFSADPKRQIQTYAEAVQTVDCHKAVGKPHSLWCAFAHFYEKHGDFANARAVFEKATQAQFAYMDDLSHVWCQWAEMELKHKNFKRARDVLSKALEEPETASRRMTPEQLQKLPPQAKLYRSVRVWSLYLDLLETAGNLPETRTAYERIIGLRAATPQVILNYAHLLKEQNYFEDAFQVYEKGVSLFKYPQVEPIWRAYVTGYVDRHKGRKPEQAREIFRQACKAAPEDSVLPFFLMWADWEERFGLSRHCFAVYEQAVREVPREERARVYRLFAAKARSMVGISKVREVYQSACEAMPPHDVPSKDVLELATEYALVERDLQEIDRARAILIFVSHLAEPSKHQKFWALWEDFEARHGNEGTFYDMTRIKRSVAVEFTKQHLNTTNAEAVVAVDEPADDPIARLEAAVSKTAVAGFVSGGVQGGQVRDEDRGGAEEDERAAKRARMVSNPEEIDLGDDDDM